MTPELATPRPSRLILGSTDPARPLSAVGDADLRLSAERAAVASGCSS